MATAQARARHGSYIFQRPGSSNWYIKLRSPGEKRKEHSLGTSDKLEAEAFAGKLIAEHKAKLLAARPRIETTWQHKLEPGREHVGEDGSRIIATDKDLIYMGHNGAIIRTEPNGGLAYQLVASERLNGHGLALAYINANGEAFGKSAPRLTVAKRGSDDAIIETYLDHGGKKKTGIHGYYRREALDTWAVFKRLTANKPLKECTRDDGRKLVRHFQEQGLKSATIGKKIAWLNSAVHFAINESRFHGLNPFSGIAPDGDANGKDDTEDRLPLDDADMKAIKRNLGDLSNSDQLLVRMLASTGMRLSEAFEIDSEETERGIRFCIVGRKTEASKRRVPFPAAVLPYLPKKITGPLLASDHADPVDAASKRLNRFLDDCGIDDPRKVVHSLRHRAKDRLRAFECPDKMQQWLLGHDEKTVADSYGKGPPVKVLKKWIEKIRF
jgi:integrase